jgi:hypothetical protein
MAEENFILEKFRESEAAISILPFGETKPRAYLNEVNVQTLISSTIFAQAIASKIFKVYSPALFARRVGCKVRSFADSSNVLSDLSGQIVYMTRIPRILLVYGTSFGNSGQLTAKQKAKSQQ